MDKKQKMTRQDHFTKELTRCERVLQKLELSADTQASPTDGQQRRHLLKSHTMTSFDAYMTRSDVSPTLTSSSYLDSLLLHGNGRHIRRTAPPAAWGSDPHRTLLGERRENRPAQSTGSQVTSQQLSTDDLCDFLARRGLGDPRDVMRRRMDRRRQMYEDRRVATERARRRERDRRGVTYYLEKLKGQAFLDSAAANCRASAFCELQGTRALRTASASYRHPAERLQHVDLFSRSGTGSGSGSDDDGSLGGDGARGREEVFERIKAWLSDCERAREGAGPPPQGAGKKVHLTEPQPSPDGHRQTTKLEQEGQEDPKSNLVKLSNQVSSKDTKTCKNNVNKSSKKWKKTVRILPHI